METIDKDLANINQVRNEYQLLKRNHIDKFTCFLRDKSIFVNLRTPKGKPYIIRYCIKGKFLYYEFRKCIQSLSK